MAYQNQPNRVYFSSDDAKLNNEHSGNFTVKLDDPIVGAKKCNLVSCEYPSSFYNILPTDTFHFDEVYRDNTNANAEVKRIRFSYKGLPEANYTGSTLATALSSALTYTDSSSTPLVGVDADFTKFISSDLHEGGNLSTTNTSVPDQSNNTNTTNSFFLLKEVITTSSSINTRLKKLVFNVGTSSPSHSNSEFYGYGYLIKFENNTSKIVIAVSLDKFNPKVWNPSTGLFEIDLFSEGIDLRIQSGVSYRLGVLLPPTHTIKANSVSVSALNWKTSNTSDLVNLLRPSVINHFTNTSHIFLPSFTYNLVSNGANISSIAEPDMYVELVRIYDYTYNNSSTNHYTKVKLTVAYNDITKRFSIQPEKHPDYKDISGQATSGNNFPFFKTQYRFLHPTNYTNLDSFLEIPVVENNRASLNFILGANESKSLSYASSLDLTTNHPLIFPHIPRLIRFPYVYLTCDFVNDSSKTGKNKTNILQKLPLSSEYGNVNFFNVASGDSLLYCDVSRDNIQTVGFSVIDKENNIVDLNGGEVSFTVNFEY